MRALIDRLRRRDPGDYAPTKAAYRVERLLLRPGTRRFLRLWLPLGVLTAIAAGWVAEPGNRASVVAAATAWRDDLAARPEFRIERLEVVGADAELAAAVQTAADVDLPVSSLDLDLAGVNERVAALAPVAGAETAIREHVLRLEVDQRTPVAVWRGRDGLRLLDAEGVVLGRLEDRAGRPDLPLILGEGADVAVAEALALLDAAGPVAEGVRGLVRVGERRWDVVMADGKRLFLPAAEPGAAIGRVRSLAADHDLLSRDLRAVDLRQPDRTILRLTPEAVEARDDTRIEQTRAR